MNEKVGGETRMNRVEVDQRWFWNPFGFNIKHDTFQQNKKLFISQKYQTKKKKHFSLEKTPSERRSESPAGTERTAPPAGAHLELLQHGSGHRVTSCLHPLPRSLPERQHGVDVPQQVPHLVHQNLHLLVLLTDLLWGTELDSWVRTNRTRAGSEQRAWLRVPN